MADTIVGAIQEAWNASKPLRDLVPSGLWLDVVPEDRGLPWVVLRHHGEVPVYTSEIQFWEEGRFAFECYAVWAQQAEAIATAVKRAFDPRPYSAPVPLPLTLDTGATMSWLRSLYTVRAAPPRTGSGDVVYVAVVEYLSRVERNSLL